MKQSKQLRALLSLTVAAALLLAAAAVVLHSHEDLAGRMCQACKIAQLPVIQLEPGPAIQAPAPVRCDLLSARPASPCDPVLTAEPSRAPPA
jgi:hypothetical protein